MKSFIQSPKHRAWAAAALARLNITAGGNFAAQQFPKLDPADLAETVTAFRDIKGGLSFLATVVDKMWGHVGLPAEQARADRSRSTRSRRTRAR